MPESNQESFVLLIFVFEDFVFCFLGREGGREGRREGGKEGGREGGRERRDELLIDRQ